MEFTTLTPELGFLITETPASNSLLNIRVCTIDLIWEMCRYERTSPLDPHPIKSPEGKNGYFPEQSGHFKGGMLWFSYGFLAQGSAEACWGEENQNPRRMLLCEMYSDKNSSVNFTGILWMETNTQRRRGEDSLDCSRLLKSVK